MVKGRKMFKTMITVVALITASVSYGTELKFTGGAGTFPQDLAGCVTQPNNPWCKNAPKAVGTKKITPDVLIELDKEVFKYLIPTAEAVDSEYTSSADSVLAGKKFKGDCDDAVGTAIDLLNRRGYDISNVYRVAVSTKKGSEYDHMMAVAIVDGQIWVFADTFKWKTQNNLYTPIVLATKATSDQWYDGVIVSTQ